MENLGFIRDKLDIKILILFVLEKLPGPVEPLVLSDLTLLDGGFTWFDYTDCLADLVKTGHITEADGKYEITEKGRQNVNTVASSLPYSVRAKAERLTAQVAAAMRRSSMIETASEPGSNGGQTVSLRLSDGMGEIISLRLAVPDETQAQRIEAQFRDRAEEIYNRIIQIFIEGESNTE
ncbi:MAG: DUF4364 family protein [Oscillospiraceae bacterium]|nr:DUF4364 family protein [Oscillospiraceae bacterium]